MSVKPNTHRRRRRDETVESRRVGGVNTPVGSRDPVYNFLYWQLTSDDIMTSLLKETVKIHEYYTTQQTRMFTNMQRHMLRHIVLLCHWLQNCKLGHGRRLRCAFASPNPSAVVANSCTCSPTHRRRRRDATNSFVSSAVCTGLQIVWYFVPRHCIAQIP